MIVFNPSNLNNEERFLINIAISNSIIAGLSTRNKNFPIYSEKNNCEFSLILNKAISDYLFNLNRKVKDSEITDNETLSKYWGQLKEEIEAIAENNLYDGIFRLGVSQKIINLFLKFLLCYGIVTPDKLKDLIALKAY